MAKNARKAVSTYAPLNPIVSEERLLAAFMTAADAFDEKHTRSREAARAQLRKEGIITPSGRLTKRFGG